MFTGDHLETAIAVAKECNIISETDLEGAGGKSDKIAVLAQDLRNFFEDKVEIDAEGEVVYKIDKQSWE